MSNSENNLRNALRESMRMNGDAPRGAPPVKNDTRPDNDGQVRLPRISVDFKLPLWGLATAGFVAVWDGVSMYFELVNVSKQMQEMRTELKASNAATMQVVSEQALIKFRLEKLEAARAPAPDRR